MSTWFLVWLLAQVHVWAGSLCPLLGETAVDRLIPYPEISAGEVLRDLDFGPEGNAIAILGTDHHPAVADETLRIVQMGQGPTRDLASFDIGQSVDEGLTISPEGEWLYAVADRGASTLILARGGEPAEISRQMLVHRRLARWLPLLESTTPSGALVQFPGGDLARVSVVGFDGAREVGAFPLSPRRMIEPRWMASLLPDGRVAVSWIEEEAAESFVLEIRVVGSSNAVTLDGDVASAFHDGSGGTFSDALSIRCEAGRRFHHSLSGVAAGSGRLAIVVRSLTVSGAIIQAVVIDPDRPGDAVECVRLDEGDGEILEPRVLSFGDDFIAFWRTGQTESRLMARRFRSDGQLAGEPVSLGEIVPGIRMRSHYFVRKQDDETFVTLVPAREGFVVRSIPADIRAVELQRRVRERICPSVR